MKLGIDISQVVYKGSGVARFTDGLTRAICKYDSSNEWHFFFSSLRQGVPRDLAAHIKSRGFKLHTESFPPTVLTKVWNDVHFFDIQNFTGKLDWFITSDWTEPPATCKKATIIHDLAFKRFPETVDKTILRTQQKRLKWVARESKVIFADSRATKSDITEYLGIPADRIHVNYPGVELPSLEVNLNAHPLKNTKYILTVGKREPRKNLDRLIEAFSKAKPKDVQLVIVGEKGWGDTPKPDKTSSHIHFLGYVPDEELVTLYKNAIAFAYPSLWEGFGYPVIESMLCGTPVITSKTSSLGEIARNNALIFNPTDVNGMANTIKRILRTKAVRTRISKKAKKYAQTFTWHAYYDKFIHTLT